MSVGDYGGGRHSEHNITILNYIGRCNEHVETRIVLLWYCTTRTARHDVIITMRWTGPRKKKTNVSDANRTNEWGTKNKTYIKLYVHNIIVRVLVRETPARTRLQTHTHAHKHAAARQNGKTCDGKPTCSVQRSRRATAGLDGRVVSFGFCFAPPRPPARPPRALFSAPVNCTHSRPSLITHHRQ